MTDNWSIVEPCFDLKTARAYEGLFTQGSGYLHVRGSLEEHLLDDPQNLAYTRMPASVTAEKLPASKLKWGTYVPGVFGKHPLLNNEMINLPFFIGMAPRVAGEKLDMEASRVSEYRRELLLRDGVLCRTLVWHTAAGATIRVRFERFVSASRPGLCVQRLTLTSDRDVTVEVAGGIDADVRTNGYDHFKNVTIARHDATSVSCGVTTDAGDIVQMVSELCCDLKTPPSGLGGATRFVEEHRRGTLVVTLELQAGRIATVEKRTAITTSRDLHPVGAAALLRELTATTYDALHRENADAWAARWQASDVEIEGDDRSQLAMRTSLYHLMRCHVAGDDRVAIDAKGYAGEAYWGRFFWDTEMYLLPFFLYTDPARARTLVDFRVRSLPAAMVNAKSYGYPGARYATESDGDGAECCPNWQYRDHEIHVTADVVYAFAHYASAVQADYLAGASRNVLLETARYWLARMDRRQGDDYPSLLGVMGPDEYAPITSNNAYTNCMVKFSLAHSAQAARAAGLAGEAQRFADASRKLPIPTRADGLVLECEEFERLAEPRFEEFWLDRTQGFANQVSQERLYRSKCLKQADVLMMMFLFAGEFTDQQVRQAYEYYLPYTTHDSSLSVSVHAIIACRLGLDEQAWRFWRASSELDLDVQHGGAENGIHIAAAGANWQVAVLGFAGMATAMEASSCDAGVSPACAVGVSPACAVGVSPASELSPQWQGEQRRKQQEKKQQKKQQDADKMSATHEGKMPSPHADKMSASQKDVLTLRPRLPKAWTRLAFPIIWKGTPVYVEITGDKTVVTNRGKNGLTVRVGDKQSEIPAGSSASF